MGFNLAFKGLIRDNYNVWHWSKSKIKRLGPVSAESLIKPLKLTEKVTVFLSL